MANIDERNKPEKPTLLIEIKRAKYSPNTPVVLVHKSLGDIGWSGDRDYDQDWYDYTGWNIWGKTEFRELREKLGACRIPPSIIKQILLEVKQIIELQNGR
jgi:hypothetical protein